MARSALDFDFGTKGSGKLASEFCITAGKSHCRSANKRRALFFEFFERCLCLLQLILQPPDFSL